MFTKIIKVTFPFLIIIFFFNSILPAGDKKSLLDISYTFNDFYKIAKIKEYIYESSFGETTTTYKDENGLILFSNISDDFKYIQKLDINEKGVFIHETYKKIKVMLIITKEGSHTYDKPLLRMPFPLSVGQEWKTEGIEIEDDERSNVVVTGKVLAEEEVTTPAGKYKALKIKTHMLSTSGSENEIIEWYVKGIGMVKSEIIIQGGGFMGFVRDLLGYGTITFELKEIKYKD